MNGLLKGIWRVLQAVLLTKPLQFCDLNLYLCNRISKQYVIKRKNTFVRINIVKKRPIPVFTLIEENVLNYLESAIREFLMNSLMHRSYEITSYIKFYQYSDRTEIVNPGGLYGNARPENFPNVSDYRNLVISESMRVMGYVNRL